MAERIPDVPAAIVERKGVCRRFHFLGILLRGRSRMHPGSPEPPGDLIWLSSQAAQPDHPGRVAREGRISTEEYAAGLEELERWCHAHGAETLVRYAANRPVLVPIRLEGHG